VRDFGAAMARMRQLRARISETDSAHRYRKLGVDVFIGEGRFAGSDTIDVVGRHLRFSKAAICTGGRASIPAIPGLKEAGYLTNETVFELTELPPRLAVIGGGPVGCELAQAFARFGSRVALLEQTGSILPREDADAAAVVMERMRGDGTRLLFESIVKNVEKRGQEKIIHFETNGNRSDLAVDEILVAAGRVPNVDGLGLESAGVTYDSIRGVNVDANLRTTNPRIFAAGDICFPFKFTHAADALAQIVIQNALFPHPLGIGLASTDSIILPWCTYTDPELAHIGMYEAEAKGLGMEVETITVRLDEVDRAVLDGEEEGFARIHIRKGTDKILGATIVAAHAGEIIAEVALAMKAGAGLGTVSRTIHPYPTQSEVIRKAALAWRKTTLTEGRKKILRKWFAWTR